MSCATELNQPCRTRSPFRACAVASAGPLGSTISSAVSKSHCASPAKCFSASAGGQALPAPPGRAVIIAGPWLGDWGSPGAPSVFAEPLFSVLGSLPGADDAAGSTASSVPFDGSARPGVSLTLSVGTGVNRADGRNCRPGACGSPD